MVACAAIGYVLFLAPAGQPGGVQDGAPRNEAAPQRRGGISATQGILRVRPIVVVSDKELNPLGLQDGSASVFLLIENESKNRLASFHGGDPESLTSYRFQATDEHGNNYPLPVKLPHPCAGLTLELRPGDFALGMLFISPPVAQAKELRLTLPPLVPVDGKSCEIRIPLHPQKVDRLGWRPDPFGGVDPPKTMDVLYVSPDFKEQGERIKAYMKEKSPF